MAESEMGMLPIHPVVPLGDTVILLLLVPLVPLDFVWDQIIYRPRVVLLYSDWMN
ncbi:MAG: hypothetical protein BAJATHORv1_30039 [Candidatus Thorarchaeota archaeon]|nr:MAG: hypothetical protein BAJATHORv1_30039 [Candidatus Thorarchaeota archaeon]